MDELIEITEIVDDLGDNEIDEEIEKGLEIVALEMGNVLEQLKTKLGIEEISSSENTKAFQDNDKLDNLDNQSNNYEIEIPNYKMAKATPENSKKANKNKKPKMSPSDQVTKIDKPNYKVEKVNHKGSCSSTLSKNITKTSSVDGYKLFSRNSSKISKEPCKKICKVYEKPSHSLNAYNKEIVAIRQKRGMVKSRYLKGNDVIKELKEQVEIAMRDKKTFSICGNYYALRRALLSRGWVEKMRISYNTSDRNNLLKLQASNIKELIQGLHDPQKGYIYKRMIMTKLMGTNQVDFYWDTNFDCFRMLDDKVKCTLVNRFKRDVFSYTTKHGLCESMKNSYWYQIPGVSWVRHPRSYNLTNNEEPKDFINDFKLTAAMSLLKWVVRSKTCGSKKILSDKGRVPLSVYHFAATEVAKALRRCNHEDIDYEIEEAMDYEWNAFLEHYYKIVHMGHHFNSEGALVGVHTINSLQNSARSLLMKTEKYWPHLKMDGIMNVWILKPINGCRGRGIYLCRTLQYILKIIKSNTANRYIIQKYIERPFLICNTKFDIRQWFLISCSSPLTIWIYRDFYLRFSSQLYTLHKLHESVHLTNNSIQCRYKNCRRNPILPECNMWDSKQLKKYLARIGYPTVYDDIIYPGIKECLTATILINQSYIDTRKNCFELYGSDFMLTEDFKPWLIEINARPALYASTPVTARLCPQVLEDLIKVVIDNAKNPEAPTGKFELLYKEKKDKLPNVKHIDLNLTTQVLPKSYFYNPELQIEESGNTLRSKHSQTDADINHINIKKISKEMRKTLENLLSIIRTEREKRKILKNSFSQVDDIKELFASNNTDSKESLRIQEIQPEEDSIKNTVDDKAECYKDILEKTNETRKWSANTKAESFFIQTKCCNENKPVITKTRSNLESKTEKENFNKILGDSECGALQSKKNFETNLKNVRKLHILKAEHFDKVFSDNQSCDRQVGKIERNGSSTISSSEQFKSSVGVFNNLIESIQRFTKVYKKIEK